MGFKNEMTNEELEQVAGGWTPAPIIATHELYYLTDEQISELLHMGWKPGDTVYVRLVSDTDGSSTGWAGIDQLPQLIAQMSAGTYRVQFTIVKAA